MCGREGSLAWFEAGVALLSEVSVNVSVDLQSLQPMVKKRRLVQVGTRVALLYLKTDHRVGRLENVVALPQ